MGFGRGTGFTTKVRTEMTKYSIKGGGGKATAILTELTPTYGTVSTSSDEYQTVKEIEVTEARVGILRTIEIATDNYAVAQWKLVISEIEVFADKKFPDSFTKELPDLEMSAGQKATVSVKSNGINTINAYCDFGYKEVG